MIYGERKATYPIQVDAETNYCDLAKYIDEHKHLIKENGENPSEEEKIFRYLYAILYASAVKAKYFINWEDYDKYSLYGAGQIYMSMRDKEAHAGEIRRGKEIKPIKNTLDFIHIVMPHLKVNYQQDNFRLVCDPGADDRIDTERALAETKQNIQEDYNYALADLMDDSIKMLPTIIKKVVAESPYTDPVILKNLKISCKLTLINSVTLPSKIKEDKKSYEALCKAFLKESDTKPILWHLPEGMSGYISMLVKKIKVRLTEEINDTSHQFDLEDNILDAIMASGFESSNKSDLEDE